MRALANLSKYYGCYDTWRGIKQRFDLKWTTSDDLTVFNSMMDNSSSYPAMLGWLRDTCSKVPKASANILIYDTLTGLRPDEACQSIALVCNDLNNYLKKEVMTIEHYKYPETFLRKTKKAYISIVNEEILEVGKNAHQGGYNALRLKIKRRGLDMHMGYCRKIFGTYLRMNGIESETIDLLQGRTPRSVFARHYFRPDFEDSCRRVRNTLVLLQKEIGVS